MLATGLALTAIVVLAASSGSVHPFVSRPPRATPALRPINQRPGQPASTAPLPAWLDTVVTVALLMLAVLIALALLWALFVALRMQRDKAVLAESDRLRTKRLADAVATGLAQVELGTPDDAVIACWVALERAAAAADLTRRPAETSAEFTARVFSTARVSHDDLQTLAALFRKARYSKHPTAETDRATARAVLRRLQVGLQRSPVERVIARVSSRSTSDG